MGVQDPSQLCFVAWSDAALANRIDLGSTGGYVVAATTPEIFEGHRDQCLLCRGDQANW